MPTDMMLEARDNRIAENIAASGMLSVRAGSATPTQNTNTSPCGYAEQFAANPVASPGKDEYVQPPPARSAATPYVDGTQIGGQTMVVDEGVSNKTDGAATNPSEKKSLGKRVSDLWKRFLDLFKNSGETKADEKGSCCRGEKVH